MSVCVFTGAGYTCPSDLWGGKAQQRQYEEMLRTLNSGETLNPVQEDDVERYRVTLMPILGCWKCFVC